MELRLHPEFFFPKSVITTPFGWDAETFPSAPRLHHAVDRAGKGSVFSPVKAEKVIWIDSDSQGNSVLRLIFLGGEVRILHFLRDELDSLILASAISNAGIDAGTRIGPAGNKGISISSSGGDGRHIHYSLILSPGAYDDQLAQLAGPGWNSDRSSDFRAKYGKAFIQEAAIRGVRWMNQYVIAKADPYYVGRIRFVVDSVKLFGL
jgi:hypothetical protein